MSRKIRYLLAAISIACLTGAPASAEDFYK
jgi:hypothetical protein